MDVSEQQGGTMTWMSNSADQNTLVLQDPDYGLDILRRINTLRSERVFTDASICVGQEEFPCHRNILAASSPYFKAMFTSELREGLETVVSINEVSPWIIKRILEYVYTGRVEITTDNAQELLAAGSLFNYPAIIEACCQFLKCQLFPSNCLGIENFAILHSCKRLQEDAHKFVLENFSAVVEFEEFLEFSAERLKVYVSSDWIDVRKEETVYEAIMRWLHFDLDNRKYYMFQLLEFVRLPIVDMSRLKLIEQDPLIQSCEKCMLLVKEAQEQHESIHDQHGRRRRSMQNSQVHPRPSTVAKEKMVVVSGWNSYVTRKVEMYDPQKDRWSDLPDFPKAVSWFSVCAVSNCIVVTGGILDARIIQNCWKFDSVKRTWIEIAPMLKPRARHASETLDDRLYVFGGVTYGAFNSQIDLDHIECYDSILNTWSVVGRSTFPRKQSQVVLFGDMLVEVGGLQGGGQEGGAKVDTMDSYKCSENGELRSPGEQFILPEPIQFAKILVINGIFYIIWEDLKKMIALDPSRRTFQSLADTHYAHKHSGATVLGDKVYITGGLIDSRPSNIVECYDTTTDTWTVGKSMTETRAFHGCVTIQL
ncbi:kelch-like protein 21 [Mizuhopecten yessoensis]|uniref:kelch-like protein 21 n=1 Tax=Mizuhopecten yessoensis TaxID=6573 RepID=UPI000B45E693|nr:kelch-like protein 21 [Mizuhopecten yessoensis]XP_021363094.1 kelch-like protein 21 [Mizuhopecten yessoensis]XP_021363095.1 kelch-like protein 21 [Mizuhopecten yessoensis]XP_021363096.1 kelch-like protein 21 [Mizuhopecten yessoensis]XP_021363098.1 kelch-like protein 21 [Mizuhopecten yessoensis]XP_021363099.1 kelch-like protein 21 [Mizuhopecten yessoensis]XP_021363100.1 kelch-like protein 21 [Mizuhopecten yessoensis]